MDGGDVVFAGPVAQVGDVLVECLEMVLLEESIVVVADSYLALTLRAVLSLTHSSIPLTTTSSHLTDYKTVCRI